MEITTSEPDPETGAVEITVSEPDPETGAVETLLAVTLSRDDAAEWATLSEGRQALLLRMRSEFEVNWALREAGIQSLDDLPMTPEAAALLRGE